MDVHMLMLMRHLDRARYQPVALVSQHSDPFRATPREFIQMLEAASIPILTSREIARAPRLEYLLELRNMRRLLRSANAAIAHIHTNHPKGARKVALAARAGGIPVVRTEHLPPTAFNASQRPNISTRVMDALTARIVTVSECDRREQERIMKRAASKLHCSQNGIDVTRFAASRDSASAKQRLGFSAGETIVGSVGRLAKQKGHKYLLDATARLVNRGLAVRALLVGTGECEPELRQQAAELGIASAVTFAGYQSEAATWVQAMDIAALPSLFEGLSLTLLEYMAAGKPIIVSDYPSMLEAVHHEQTALVVPMRDADALARAIERLMADRVLAQRLGDAAYERAHEHFTIQRNARDLMDLYDRVLSERRS
jgi:glycosyltransferase involved in cell wall biosynthesis